ncbi:MAG: DUF6364 family protein [Desulfonatronovibrio sp.]
MQTSKLTIRLPKDDLEFAKEYARQHGVSLTQLVNRYFQSIQNATQNVTHAEVQKITGLIPQDIDLNEYLQHIEKKHS